jgi:hypothetical protein
LEERKDNISVDIEEVPKLRENEDGSLEVFSNEIDDFIHKIGKEDYESKRYEIAIYKTAEEKEIIHSTNNFDEAVDFYKSEVDKCIKSRCRYEIHLLEEGKSIMSFK